MNNGDTSEKSKIISGGVLTNGQRVCVALKG